MLQLLLLGLLQSCALLAWMRRPHPSMLMASCHGAAAAAVQGESFQEDGQAILGKFHDWVGAGADGVSGWELEKENHEGWRVAVDEACTRLHSLHGGPLFACCSKASKLHAACQAS
jgi:hypothetical protein